jgi:hypothetical protein
MYGDITLFFVFCLGVITGWNGHAVEKIMGHMEEEIPRRIVVCGCTGMYVCIDTRLY